MATLDRKLIRDALHLRGQVIAISLVVACGVASFVAMRSTYNSLLSSQQSYYESYRFAEVFAQLKRAPDSIATDITEIPGVGAAEFRVVADVTLDVPGLAEPAKGRIISIPEQQRSMLNDLYLKAGRYIEAERADEVLVSAAFAEANQLKPGSLISAVINGRWQKLQIVGVALSPEYVYEVRSGEMFPDNRRSGVLWMSREALGPAFDMKGAFNDVAITLAPGAAAADVIQRLDDQLNDYGGLGAYTRADDAEAQRAQAEKFRALADEKGFYAQHDALQRALTALLPERPGVIDVYALTAGLYASEDVFMREVRLIDALMRQRFDAQGRSLVLLNNPTTVHEFPLASATSLGLALKHIGSLMNRDEDVLMMYLSSHGSEKHDLSVNFWPLRLKPVNPVSLRSLASSLMRS